MIFGLLRARLLLVLAAAALALLLWSGPARAGTAELTTDKGVVQAVSATDIVLRELDGSTLTLALGPRTVFRLNGSPATVIDIRPGLVAAVTHNGDRPARLVRAFGRVQVVERGVVESVTPAELVLRRADGTRVTVELGSETKVRRLGRPAGRAAVRPGRLARVTYVPGSPARLVAVVRPPG